MKLGNKTACKMAKKKKRISTNITRRLQSSPLKIETYKNNNGNATVCDGIRWMKEAHARVRVTFPK